MSGLPDLLRRLVAVESVNPLLVPGGSGEQEIARLVASEMERSGLETHLQEAAPGRPNAIGVLCGSGGGRSLLLNAHLDTVSLGAMDRPLELGVDGDRAYGRGAYDMKGSLAAILCAVHDLAEGPRLRGDVIVAGVADEEYSSLGTQKLLESVRADACLVAEPTGMHVCVGHKGFAWLRIQVEGVAAHGSRPDLGVDAIAKTGEVLVEVERLGERLASAPHPLLGPASIHASTIAGGQELSSYPARCTLELERRTLPGETQSAVEQEVADLLGQVRQRAPTLQAQADVFFWRDPFWIDPDAPLVADLLAVCRECGLEPQIRGESPWMDSAFLAAAGMPTVVFGPGGGGAHGSEEWVSVSDLERCREVFAALARRVCG